MDFALVFPGYFEFGIGASNRLQPLRASTDGNLLWYRVVNGIPYEQLGIGVRIPIPKETWEELRVECSGSATRCFLNGNLVIPPHKPGTPTRMNAARQENTSANHPAATEPTRMPTGIPRL